MGGTPGCLYLIPVEVCPCTMIGQDLMVIPCLWVLQRARQMGVGKALLAEAEQETRRQGKKALATVAFYHDFWFMPAAFFEQNGFSVVNRQGKDAILWRCWTPPPSPPTS